jgi:hypothetical protein
MPIAPCVISTEHGCETRQKARQPPAISASANLDGNSLGADRCPNLKPPAFAILGRNQGGCHDRYEHFAGERGHVVTIEPPILPRW